MEASEKRREARFRRAKREEGERGMFGSLLVSRPFWGIERGERGGERAHVTL